MENQAKKLVQKNNSTLQIRPVTPKNERINSSRLKSFTQQESKWVAPSNSKINLQSEAQKKINEQPATEINSKKDVEEAPKSSSKINDQITASNESATDVIPTLQTSTTNEPKSVKSSGLLMINVQSAVLHNSNADIQPELPCSSKNNEDVKTSTNKLAEHRKKLSNAAENVKNRYPCLSLIPNWLIVVCSILAISVLTVSILSGTLQYYFRNPGVFNEDCSNRQCNKKLSLICVNEKCICDKNYFYLKGCQFKKSYLKNCNNNSNECLDNTNMICSSGVCTCDKSDYWDGQVCKKKSQFAEPCQSSDSQCYSSSFLYCDIKSGKCLCQNDRLVKVFIEILI